jgi:long-subunit fatty acid transport protein
MNFKIMIKRFYILTWLLFGLEVFAQQGTSSPYSFYGIGDVRFKGTLENRAMGGITSHGDSIHVNLQNPAYYSALRLTSFSVGATFNAGRIESNTESSKAQRTALDYLALVIPTKKIGFSFGLIPFSSVGYNVYNVSSDAILRQYSGSGGINKVYFGSSYAITPTFSIGADVQYNFGKIETKAINSFSDVEYATREINVSIASGVNFNIGARYQKLIDKKYLFYTSAVYRPGGQLTLSNDRTLTLINWAGLGTVETPIGDPVNYSVPDDKMKLPTQFDLGIGYGKNSVWSIGANILYQSTSDFGARYNTIDNVQFEQSVRFSLGGYFIPNYKSFSNYLARIVYRAGVRHENTGLVINNKSITDTAFTTGFGFPIRGTFSNLNVLFEMGSRGTQSNNLVRERYLNVGFSLSFNDQWFQKRKYD